MQNRLIRCPNIDSERTCVWWNGTQGPLHPHVSVYVGQQQDGLSNLPLASCQIPKSSKIAKIDHLYFTFPLLWLVSILRGSIKLVLYTPRLGTVTDLGTALFLGVETVAIH